MRATRRALRRGDRGLALVTVILVLAALLVMVTPFLITARNADQSSAQLFDRVQASVAVETGRNHARAVLERTHFANIGPLGDETPWFDSAEEIKVTNQFAADFMDANDDRGVMWDLTVDDLAGRIDLNSAGPYVMANLLQSTARFSEPVTDGDEELPISGGSLPPSGFVWSRGELIGYSGIEDGELTGLVRGLGARFDEDDNPLAGPKPSSSHGIGAAVIDQRAFGVVGWRIGDGGFRTFDSYEQLREVDELVLAEGGIGADGYLRMRELGTCYGAGRDGSRWQRPERLVSGVQGGVTGTIRVSSARYFNVGSTIRVREGELIEHAIVQSVSRNGAISLDRALTNDFSAFDAEVSVLARRPVNINTASASVLEVLFTNLKIRDRNSRVTIDEARQLAGVVVASRPIDGFEDFLTRIVLPAAGIEELPGDAPVIPEVFERGGGGFIDPWDAVAVYANALNANDFSLDFSTQPIAFTSREVFDIELRAAVNAKSGVERFSMVRETVELITPQRELMALWARQADFDEALRLTRGAPYWMTGPAATTRFDPAGSIPPTRLWAQLGTYQGQLYLPGVTGNSSQMSDEAPTPERIFPSTEPDDWIQLAPARTDEEGQRQGRVLHFDHETRSPEGRYLPDGSIRRGASDGKVGYAPGDGLARQVWLSMWVRPRDLGDSCIFDLAGDSVDTDRISLVMEGEDLVLRLRDGGGDHPDTPNKEWSELRFAIGTGEGPGIPANTWTHLAFDVAGSRPDQMSLFVNGTTHGVRTPGLSRLSGSVDMDTAFIPLESTDGFPPRGAARIGAEVIEYVLETGGLNATYNEVGPMAGFGGRNARVRWTDGDPPVPANLENVDLTHEAGTTVEVYGYSTPFRSDVPSGSASLTSELGPWRVGVMKGVIGGSETNGDPITVQIQPPGSPVPITIGLGWGLGGNESAATGILLGAAERPDEEDAEADAEVMTAFSPDGGYAALIQVGVSVGAGQVDQTANLVEIGGIEVFRYSGWDGQILSIAARGDNCTELTNLTVEDDEGMPLAGTKAFLSEWTIMNGAGVQVQTILRRRCFVVPISVPAPGANTVSGFLAADAENPQFAQFTEPDLGELTEWVCYNWFEPTYGQLVRDDPTTLQTLRAYLLDNIDEEVINDPPNPGGGGGGAGGGGSSGLVQPETSTLGSESVAPALGAHWQPMLGVANDEALPITRGAREIFQHRGVLGTFPQEHVAGTLVLPVVQIAASNSDGGMPGRFDPAFLFAADVAHPGWPVMVHRSHKPGEEVVVHGWEQSDPNTLEAFDSGLTFMVPNVGNLPGIAYVAFDRASPEPMVAGVADPNDLTQHIDTRSMCRMTAFPSGERPRVVEQVSIGGSVRQGENPIPSAEVDEVVFGSTQFGEAIPFGGPEAGQGGALRLAVDFGEGGDYFYVSPKSLRVPLGTFGTPHTFLSDLPNDGGLLRIGDEILAFEECDVEQGEVIIAPNGRGLLGTTPQPHAAGEPVQFLSHFTMSLLSGGVGGGDPAIPLVSTEEFPHEGTVLIGEELVHFTRQRGGTLEMPSGSTEAGMQDGRGPGLFRGRYGTAPQSHGGGAPVILFPFRYWDRWAPEADAPELSYFSFEVSQPGAWHDSLFWVHEEAQTGGPLLRALIRTDPSAPWDGVPGETPGLDLFTSGFQEGEPVPLGEASDLVEARFFIEYGAGSYDAITGMSHGWKASPRLSQFGVFYRAPSMTLRSVNR